MFQLNLPKKTVSTIHVAVVCLLIVLALVFSFLPIITLDVTDPETAAGVNEIVGKITDAELPEIPEKINVSAIKLVKSIFLISDLVKAATNSSSLTPEEMEALENKLTSETAQDTFFTCAAIVHSITSAIDTNKTEESNFLGTIFNVIITIFAVLYLIIVTLIMPIVFIVLAVSAAIKVLNNLDNIGAQNASLANKLPGKLTIPMTIMLFQCVLPSMNYGSGTLGLWIVAIVCVFVNLAVTRLTSYEKKEFVYLNIVQGASVVSIIGFIIYFFNLVKTGIFTSFTGGTWAGYVARVLASPARDQASKDYLIDALLILIYLIVVLSSVNFLVKCCNRLSCAMSKRSSGNASLIVNAVLLLIVYIMPTVVAGRKSFRAFDILQAEGDASFLILSPEQKSALTSVLVGIIIMIVAEIAVIVLEKVFCKDMDRAAKVAVLSNSCDPAADNKKGKKAPVAVAAQTAPAAETEVAEEAATEEKEEVTEG